MFDDPLENQDFDMTELENDPDLMAELHDLGWGDFSTISVTQQVAGKPKPKARLIAAHAEPSFDVPALDVGDLDDSAVELTEEDYNDPELLAEFDLISKSTNTGRSLSSSSAGESSTKVGISNSNPSSKAIPKESRLVISSRVDADESKMASSEAKKTAIKLKNDGKSKEAVLWLRYAKEIERVGVSAAFSEHPNATASRETEHKVQNTGVAIRQPKSASAEPSSATTISIAQPKPSTSVRTQLSSEPSQGTSPSQKLNTAPSLKRAATENPFEILENALRASAASALEDAKRLKEAGDTKNAADCFRDYKKHSQDLDVLLARKSISGAIPPLFNWRTVRSEKNVEHIGIGEEDMKLTVSCAEGLDWVVDSKTTRYTVSLTYDLGIPKDNPVTGTIPGTYLAGKIDFSFQKLVPVGIKRSSRTLSNSAIYKRRKATFTLSLKRGFFYSDISVGVAALPLEALLTQCETGADCPFTRQDEKGRSKSVGGFLRVNICLRRPISTPETVVSEKRVLEVGEWPVQTMSSPVVTSRSPDLPSALQPPLPPSLAPAVTSQHACSDAVAQLPQPPQPSPIGAPEVAGNDACVSERDAGTGRATGATSKAATTSSTGPAPSQMDYSILTDIEMSDPTNAMVLWSNDVLQQEIDSVTSEVEAARQARQDPDIIFVLDTQLQALQLRMAMLVSGVESGSITMDGYLDLVRTRVQRDKVLYSFLQSKREADPDMQARNRANASKVRSRIGIMEAEIAGAEAAAVED